VVEKGFCECGCGGLTRVPTHNDRRNGWEKGVPLRFLPNHHRRGPRPAERSRVDPNPGGVCECGCGTPVAPFPSELPVVIHPRFVAGHQARKSGSDYVEEDRGFESLCWIWQRKVSGKGYGLVPLPTGGEQHAHRWMFECEHGAVGDGIDVHHRCEVRACVRPSHMEAVEHSEHIRRHWEVRRAAR
jgi:hypothetical protein